MTSRETEIRDKLTRLDPAEFQNLAQELLTQYYGYNNPTHLGSATHTATTAPGTPDTIWPLPDGKCAFLQCGHYPEKSEAKKKIKDDVEKCLDVEKRTLKSGQLVKIAIAYSCHRFDNADLDYLRGIDSRVELFGLDRIAELLARQYPNLAREHLGVEIGSGQIMSPDEFETVIEKNDFASTLKVSLIGREKEMSELLAELKNNQFVLVYGSPGYGKTRLCLEVLRLYAGENGVRPFVIQSNRMPILDDLNNDIPRNKPSAILLDDANELSDLAGFASAISKRNDIKVLMTARNYAVRYVKEAISKFCKPCLYEVGPLDVKSILKMIGEGFGIAAGKPSLSIARLSRGNMRLAYAAADVAKKRGVEVFSDMPDLIVACYGEKISGLVGALEKAALVVSVLGPHELEGNEDLERLLDKVGISHDSYVEACKALNQDELVDACRGMTAVAPGEQVLRDYLLYKALVVDENLHLADIDALRCGESRCLEITSILTGSFNCDEVVSSLETQLNVIWSSASEYKKWKMVGDYHFLLGEKGLEYILNAIEQSEPGHHDYLGCQLGKGVRSQLIKSQLLKALTSFLHKSEFGTPEELFLMALEKDVLPPEEACAVLTGSMCFNESSYSDGFRYENEVLNQLAKAYRKTGEDRYGILLVYYIEALLNSTYEGWAATDVNKVFHMYGSHVYTEAMVALRKHAIACLRELRGCPELRCRCDSVITGFRGIAGNDGAGRLWKATLEEVYSEYVSHVDAIDDAALPGFAELEKELISQGIINDEGLSFLGSSTETRIAAFAFADSSFRSGISEKLENAIKSASPAELADAISLVCSASIQSGKSAPYWILDDIIAENIDALSEFAEVVIFSGIPQYAIPDELLSKWMDSHGVEQIRNLSMKCHAAEVPEWLTRIDAVRFKELGASPRLAEDIVTGAESYGETVPYSIAMEIDFAAPGFFARYASGALRRLEKGSHAFRRLLPNDIDDPAQRAFVSKPGIFNLAEEAMLNLVNGRDAYWDADFLRFLIDADIEFPAKAVPVLMQFEASNTMKYLGEAIWQDGNGEAVTDTVWTAILEYEAPMSERKKLIALKCLLDYAIEHHSAEAVSWFASRSVQDGELVDCLPDVAMELPPDLRTEYIVLLCREEHLNPEELKKVPVFMSSLGASWTGSEIPLLQEKMDILNEVAEKLSGVAFLRHRRVLEDMTASAKRRMEKAKVYEFLSTF